VDSEEARIKYQHISDCISLFREAAASTLARQRTDMTTTLEYVSTTSSSSSGDITAAELYVVVGYLCVLAAVGSAGNALVLVVFSKKKDKLTSTLFIIALASVDLITCLVVMPYTVYMEIVNFRVASDVSCKLYQFFITCNIPFSALVMVAIAVDRYLCICHPFARVLTLDRAKILIGLLAAVAASLGACVAMFFGVYARPKSAAAGNTTTTDWSAATTSLDRVTARPSTAELNNDQGLIDTDGAMFVGVYKRPEPVTAAIDNSTTDWSTATTSLDRVTARLSTADRDNDNGLINTSLEDRGHDQHIDGGT